MPKLAAAITEEVEASENIVGGFSLLAPGKYLGRLGKVEVRKNDTTKAVSWSAEYDNLHTLDGEPVSGRQWLNLNMPQGDAMPASYTKGQKSWDTSQRMAKGALKNFFESHGYSADSDTDEMLGEWAVLIVGVSTIQPPSVRAGEKTNRVNGLEPVDESVVIPEIADVAGDDTY